MKAKKPNYGTKKIKELVEANLPLVLGMMRKLRPWILSTHRDFDRHYSDGLCALMRAARCWDKTRGIKFSTYAGHAIRMAFTNAAREAKAVKRLTGASDTALYRVKDTTAPAAASDAAEDVEPLLGVLTDRQRAVIGMRFYQGLTLKEAGDILDLTRERIRQIEAKSLKLMRAAAELRGLAPEDASRI